MCYVVQYVMESEIWVSRRCMQDADVAYRSSGRVAGMHSFGHGEQ